MPITRSKRKRPGKEPSLAPGKPGKSGRPGDEPSTSKKKMEPITNPDKMSTTKSKRKRAEKEPSPAPTKPGNSRIPHDEPSTFTKMMETMVDPKKSWPSYNVDKVEDREALLEHVLTTSMLTMEDVHVKVKEWTEQHIIPSIDEFSDDQKRRIISELEGVCLQEDWDTLSSELSVSAREQFARAVAQAMIYKVIFTTFFENPFWFCDGRMHDDSDDVDPSFTQAMAHLYDRFFVENTDLAILWRMILFRLMFNKPGSKHHSAATNSWHEYDLDRLAPCRPLAERLLESEPFRWLLAKKSLPILEDWREWSLSRVIDYGAGVIAQCEAGYGGHTLFYRLPELEAAYSQNLCSSIKHMKPHEFNGGLGEETDLEGRRLVLIVRPAVATMFSPFRKWLAKKDDEGIEFICPAMVLTGRVVPVSERGDKKKDEENVIYAYVVSDSEDSDAQGKESE